MSELVEGEPPACPLGLVLRARTVETDERVGTEGKRLGRAHRGGQRLAAVAGERERRLAQAPQRLLRQVGGRRVDGGEVRGLRDVADVVRRDLEAVAVRLPPQAQAGARHEPRLEPRLVEPGRPDLARPIRDVCGQDVEAPAPPAGRAADDDVEHRLIVAEELRDRALLGRRLVAVRAVRQDVPDGRDADPSELAPKGRPDPGERLHRKLEPLRPRGRARPGPGVGWVRAREPASYALPNGGLGHGIESTSGSGGGFRD